VPSNCPLVDWLCDYQTTAIKQQEVLKFQSSFIPFPACLPAWINIPRTLPNNHAQLTLWCDCVWMCLCTQNSDIQGGLYHVQQLLGRFALSNDAMTFLQYSVACTVIVWCLLHDMFITISKDYLTTSKGRLVCAATSFQRFLMSVTSVCVHFNCVEHIVIVCYLVIANQSKDKLTTSGLWLPLGPISLPTLCPLVDWSCVN